MKTSIKFLPVLFCVLLGFTNNALAENGFYLRGSIARLIPASTQLYDNNPGGASSWFSGGAYPIDGFSNTPSNSNGVEFAIGYRFSPTLRADLSYQVNDNSLVEFNYSTAVASFDIKSSQFMLNGYLDLAPLLFSKETAPSFAPYLLAGIGVSKNINSDYRCSPAAVCGGTATSFANNNTRSDTAWQIGAGFQWPINNSILVDVSVKHMDLGETRGSDVIGVSTGINGKLTANVISIGLFIPFGAK